MYRSSLVLIALVVLLPACRKDSPVLRGERSGQKAPPTPDYSAADRFVLYSIDGNKPPRRDAKADDASQFHGYSVLGTLDVEAVGTRKTLVQNLYRGIDPDILQPACFNPRHGIRVVLGDTTIDYLICFECSAIQIFTEAGKEEWPTGSEAEATFDRYLTEAGIRLAPKR